MELTNLVVNRTAENIAKAFGDDIEKARHGVYADTPENRRLRRVGQEYGSKKGEEAPKGRPQAKQEEPKQKGAVKKEEPKDERFSADGIVGKDGSFNKQGASYKRWAALREKVETGKATPEEKKEFAHIHNQYLNEKSRSEYERNKATDPNAKEPKYETVEERTARVKGQKEKQENENSEKANVEKLMSNKEFGSKISYINAQTDYAIKYSFDLSSISKRKGKDSVAYKRTLVKEVLEDISVSDLETISRAVDKYGADVVKKAVISENKNNNSSEVSDVADAIILKASKIEELLNKNKRAVIADMFDNYGGGFSKETDYFFHEYADEYAGDIIKEKGFNSFDEFETWFYEGDLNDSQYNKATRIYKMIANAIPANLYLKTWPNGRKW